MPDPVTIAVLSAALPATLTFAYHRLERLLSSRRAEPEQDLTVPDALTGTLALPLTPDTTQLEARQDELVLLRDVLEGYADGTTPVDLGDERLVRNLGKLRAALEDIYGQRLTFQGEDRPSSGPFVRQRLQTLSGEATGMEADSITGTASVDQEVENVAAGAKLTGMKVKRSIG
ncbi:hypothetical protein [Streptomyces hydrogenans]|uniref:hypothetical protein n=1 Tax=Streptomyces hydrogenans TaxID=1873719 RepID=UPI0036AF4D62